MGARCFGSSTSTYVYLTDTTPDPNRFVFNIKRTAELENYIVVSVNYPHATEYNGNKNLVYKKEDGLLEWLDATKEIDPHFLEKNGYYPYARFVGTLKGFNQAVRLFKGEK